MATYVPGGADLLDIVGGGIPDQATKDWLSQKAAAIQNTLTQTGQTFFNRAREMYTIISESQALQALRNLRSKSEDVWVSNQIQALRNLERIQTAGPIMQRWIMAQPDLRQRYLNQTVDGYSGSYTNYHGDVVGDDHYDYRRVMNGVVQVPDDDSDFVIKLYSDYMSEEEKELSLYERVDILNTWDVVKHFLDEGGEDPTCVYGSLL